MGIWLARSGLLLRELELAQSVNNGEDLNIGLDHTVDDPIIAMDHFAARHLLKFRQHAIRSRGSVGYDACGGFGRAVCQ